MNWKQFLKPTKEKVFIFIILVFMLVISEISYSKGGSYSPDIIFFIVSVFSIIVLLFFSKFGLIGNILSWVLSIFYFYLISCLFIHFFVKNNETKEKLDKKKNRRNWIIFLILLSIYLIFLAIILPQI